MKCESCGQDFTKPENIIQTDSGEIYCIFCTDSKGNLLPQNDVRESILHYWTERKNMPRKTAEEQVDEYMEKLPAWSEND